MRQMRLDPSQLLALHFLLEERNVTRAAARMSISQSSMSHRLARLREELGDPLLVRSGRTLVATRRAEAMAVPLASAMRSLDEAVAPSAEFSPRDWKGGITLYLPDLLAPLLPTVAKELRKEAPGLELTAPMVPPDLAKALGGRQPAVAFAPEGFAEPQLMSRKLGKLEFAVVGRTGHPAMRRELTLHRWLAFGHVVVQIGHAHGNSIAEVLRKKKLARNVVMRVPSFLTGLFAVASSDYLMNAPRSLAIEAMKSLPLQVCAAPIALPKVPFSMLWHERHQSDPFHEWLRGKLRQLVEPVVRGRM